MRIIEKYAYLYGMKAHLNLTIDEHLLVQVKKYVQKNDTNISELVEQFFKKTLKPAKKATIIDLVEKLERPSIKTESDLKELYYEGQARKYGF